MPLLGSPSPTSTVFHQSNAPTRIASLSETQFGKSAGGSVNGQSTGRPLVNLENRRASPQDCNGLGNRLVNGHSSGHVPSSQPNNESLEPQKISRTHTEVHRTLAHRPNASMTRSKTNYEPENLSSSREISVEEHGELRHGWEHEYNSSEFLGKLNSVCPNMFSSTSMISGWLMHSSGVLHVLHR